MPYNTFTLTHPNLKFVPKRERFSNTRLGEGVKLNNWNLQIIATRPDYQRKGVGRSLIEFAEHKVWSRVLFFHR
jgi:GNAT superfamily N-acetyltransferase